ncbi:mucin-17-like [Rhodamnia argentea]|uniref:Mucin-17-like n=1 Tax=Rhodamnia argentea TaxID=178133 RepID=A0A8B8P433_9MYRT|nr:mucin-17-like [Rhodamnia argentea]
MARGSSKCLFLFPLSLLIICYSGTLVGFYYHANAKTADSSSIKTSTFFKLKEVAPSQIETFAADNQGLSSLTNFGEPVHLFLNADQIKNVLHSEPSSISLLKLKAQTLASHPQARLEGIILEFGYQNVGRTELRKISSTLALVNGVMNSEKKMKVSVAFPLAFLERLGKDGSEEPLHRLFSSIEKSAPMVIIEDNIASEPGDRDKVVRSVIQRALLAGSLFSPNHIPLVLSLKTPVFHSTAEAAQLIDSVLKSLESNGQTKPGKIVELYTDVSDMQELRYRDVQHKRPVSFHRELLSHLKHSLRDLVTSPTTTFPVTPVSATPVTTPDTSAPTIITVPSTTPVTETPENPPATPIVFPPTNPVNPPVPVTNPAAPIMLPPTNPVNPPVPITNPAATPIAVPGAQPVTNPVTTYPSPPGGVPVTTPVTNPVAPPATTNAPAVPGQSWCVARSGVSETALQQALDYACGIGGADCSQIQQGASCYNPTTLQNHASYAFNSYYQKNPVATSCDFGGTAVVVNANPSVGSCIYQTYPLSSAPATTTTPTPTPTTASLSPPSTGVPMTSSGTPPAVVNPVSTSPTGFTLESPPAVNTSTSASTKLQPYSYTGNIVVLTTLVAARLMLAR